MKKFLLLLLFLPLFCAAQSDIEKSLKLKIAIMKNFSEKGDKGEEAFWQTKGKITYAIVNYTAEQNPLFKDLFIRQYNELLPVFNEMAKNQDERASAIFVRLVIKQEEDYRNLLTPGQLEHYRAKLTELETKDPKLSESYSALYFSDKLLSEYKAKF